MHQDTERDDAEVDPTQVRKDRESGQDERSHIGIPRGEVKPGGAESGRGDTPIVALVEGRNSLVKWEEGSATATKQPADLEQGGERGSGWDLTGIGQGFERDRTGI